MAESSPPPPPPPPPSPPPSSPDPPNELKDLDPQNPNPATELEALSQNPQPLTPANENPSVDPQIPTNSGQDKQEQRQIVAENQEQDCPEPENEHEHGPEGTSLTLSPISHPSISDTAKGPVSSSTRRPPKRKKGVGKKSQVALEKKLQTLNQNFNPIPFVPGKNLDFSRFEELLKRLGLWDFAHIEFDKSLRSDLITKLIVNYAPKQRGSYVNDCRIGVNRADLGRALKLPGKKAAGDRDAEEFPVEFLSFLDEFMSNWMLLHEDLWITPSEILNWTNLIKSGHPEKVDWAGLVWFMVEKELSQGTNLKDCYYASHLQQLIKMQKEDLLLDNPKVEVMAEEEEEDAGDVKMLDSEEICSGLQRSDEVNVELGHAQDSVTPMEILGDGDKVENVDDIEKEEIVCADKVEKVEEIDEVENAGDAPNDGSANEESKIENLDEVETIRRADEVHMEENVEIDKCVENINTMDEYVENVGNDDDHEENVANSDKHDGFDDNKIAEEEGKDGVLDFGYCKGVEQEQWFLDCKNDGDQHFLQRCNAADTEVQMEDERQVEVDEDMKHEDVEEDGHVEGFRIMQKGPLEGISQGNLVQTFETGQLHFSSTDIGDQPSLQLMSSTVENNMILGEPSMFNHAAKREIEHVHDIADHDLNDDHKKMRVDGSWGQKSSGFDMLIEQLMHLTQRVKMAHDNEKEEWYEQGSMNQQYIAHEIARKDNEIMQLRCKVDELERRMQAEMHRRDRELYLMNSVISGYRKALKDTQRAFAEFRKQCAVPDEPVYKDAGSRGVVKSIMELDKERIKQEGERKIMCHFLDETYTKHMQDCEFEWEELVSKVQALDDRLMTAAGDVEVLKGRLVKRKTSSIAPIESEDT